MQASTCKSLKSKAVTCSDALWNNFFLKKALYWSWVISEFTCFNLKEKQTVTISMWIFVYINHISLLLYFKKNFFPGSAQQGYFLSLFPHASKTCIKLFLPFHKVLPNIFSHQRKPPKQLYYRDLPLPAPSHKVTIKCINCFDGSSIPPQSHPLPGCSQPALKCWAIILRIGLWQEERLQYQGDIPVRTDKMPTLLWLPCSVWKGNINYVNPNQQLTDRKSVV